MNRQKLNTNGEEKYGKILIYLILYPEDGFSRRENFQM